MHSGRNYTLFQTLKWTRKYILIFAFTSSIPVFIHEVFHWSWLEIPWLPIALIGTAVAFYLGFKNNSSYERLWEARKIWGAIVNSSRSWAIMSMDYVTNHFALEKLSDEELYGIHKRLIYRHVAWLKALAYQLRKVKPWEHTDSQSSAMRDLYDFTNEDKLRQTLSEVLSDNDLEYVMSKKNHAVNIVSLQSKDLRQLREKGLIDDFRHVEMQNMLVDLYTQQGKSERIKNFPFPRQYATVNLIFVWLFIILVPFGMLSVFHEIDSALVWLTIPFSMVVSWVFHTMELIGDFSENPFEGLWNDVPISAMAVGIEIDLREMLDETDLPAPIQPDPEYKILM